MKLCKLVMFLTFFNSPISSFATRRTGRLERDTIDDQDTTKTPTLFQTKAKKVAVDAIDSKDEEHDPYHHLEKHIRSLSKISHPSKWSKHEVTDVTNLFPCLEPDSPVSECDKPSSFRYLKKNIIWIR